MSKIINEITEQDMKELETGDEVMCLGQWFKPVRILHEIDTVSIYYAKKGAVEYNPNCCGYFSDVLPQMRIEKIRKEDKEPVIPKGWTKYDPKVLPPEDALDIEFMCGEHVAKFTDRYWLNDNMWPNSTSAKCWRVTRWKKRYNEIWCVVRGNKDRRCPVVAVSTFANLAQALDHARDKQISTNIIAIFKPFETGGKWVEGMGLELLEGDKR